MLFLLIGFGVVRTFNSMKRELFVKETVQGKGKKKDNNEYKYHLQILGTDAVGTVYKRLIKIKNESYGSSLYMADETGGANGESSNNQDTESKGYRSNSTTYDGVGVDDCYKSRSIDIPLDDDEIPQNTESNSEENKTSALDKVQGIDELKSDIRRIIDSLVNPEKYKRLGARPTKGLLLMGPPGTGKTMLAKAIAADSKAQFIAANGSDFMEKYVGVGARRVRDLFEQARRNAPCILFIDEIDAVAGMRDPEDTNSERIQTINAFLSELDGFKDTEGVLVIAATNREDILDSAFTRAGRFDLKLTVGLPDRKGRESILRVHAENKKFTENVDIADIANKTVSFSGAELENLLNEAALIAASLNKEAIDREDLDDAFFKIVLKGNKKRREEINEMHKIVAWHESGHTVDTRLLTGENVTSVTIVGSTSGVGGVTFTQPDEKGLFSKKDLENNIKVLYAGRAAEEVYLGNSELITTGASNDIKKATHIIKSYIENYGMGDRGMIDVTQFKSFNNENNIKEASEIAKRLYKEVLELLKNEKDTLETLSSKLIEKETLYADEINEIINSKA